MSAGSTLAKQAGQTFRRIIGDDSPNDEGYRCIWHQGRGEAELLSWERADNGEVARQELTFFGKCVFFEPGHGITTGTVPASVSTTHAGLSKLAAIVNDRQPSAETLTMAAVLLEAIPKQDAYTEALLERVRAAQT